jgi:hypothetical protein
LANGTIYICRTVVWILADRKAEIFNASLILTAEQSSSATHPASLFVVQHFRLEPQKFAERRKRFRIASDRFFELTD